MKELQDSSISTDGELTAKESLMAFPAALEYANRVYRMGGLPQNLQGNTNEIACVILTGLEMDVPPMKSLQNIGLIPIRKEGKQVGSKIWMHYSLCAEILQRGGRTLIFEESTKECAHLILKKGNQKIIELKYTKEDAQREGYWDGRHLGSKASFSQWKKNPALMMRSKVLREAVRSLGICVYDMEEIEAINVSNARDVTPVKSASEAARLARQSKKEEIEQAEPIDVTEYEPLGDVCDLNVDDMMVEIGACKDIDELNGYAANIKRFNLPENDVKRLRDAYAIRKEELQGVL